MKNILLLSDTHGTVDDLMIKYAREADEVWHAGDIGDLKVTEELGKVAKLRAVYGNIDDHQIRAHFPLDLSFDILGTKVSMTHIGGYPDRYEPRVRQILANSSVDIFICGHSHILKVMPDKKNNLLHMNPGAIGRHGFHKKRTMLRFKVDKGGIKDLEVIEKER